MIITKKHLSRRTFLRGAFGAAVALPWLDAMMPALVAQSRSRTPFRFANQRVGVGHDLRPALFGQRITQIFFQLLDTLFHRPVGASELPEHDVHLAFDSRHLPQDYVKVVHDTMGMLADSGMRHLAPFAAQAVKEGYVKPIKRVFGTLVFRARERVEMPPPGDTRAARIELELHDTVWDVLYAPVIGAVGWLADRSNRLQFLTIRRYLMLVFAALVLLLVIFGVSR